MDNWTLGKVNNGQTNRFGGPEYKRINKIELQQANTALRRFAVINRPFQHIPVIFELKGQNYWFL